MTTLLVQHQVQNFDSWFSKKAEDYRRIHGIPNDWGTAVTVQVMVFGNMGDDSGTGVAFTRNPSTGAHELFGDYLRNAQGEDVVAGIRTPKHITEMRDDPMLPGVYDEFVAIAQRLEKHYRDMQDLEFTIERGKLYMLQTRNGKRTAKAALTHMTRLMAAALAPRIRVNGIAVGSIATSALETVLTDDGLRNTMVAGTPLKRLGEPEDIACAVLYLISDASSWVTGKVFEVDGGTESPAITVPTAPLEPS